VTASGDDKNPVIKLWDLRSSTSLPLATLQGHKEGVLSLSWCPTDASLLLSCGKDNRTILWDLFHLQPVYDLPSAAAAQAHEEPNAESESSRLFGGLAASSAGQRRYHVSWSPCLPGVVSASSFDRRVQFFSMIGAKSRVGRAPKWLRRPVGATFGFGGKLVSFDNKNHTAAGAAGMASSKKLHPAGSVQIKVHQVVEDDQLVDASDRFHDVVGKGMHKEYCEMKSIADDVSDDERQVWSLMNVICFGSNAREELLTHLGFDSATITAAAQSYVSTLSSSKATTLSTAEDTFGAAPVLLPAEQQQQPPSKVDSDDALHTAELRSLAKKLAIGHSAEPTIRKAIVVGNFEAAVECCLEAGLMAEALLLAQCGDSALRIRTQAAYFEKSRSNHPFLNVLHAVIRSELMSYVVASDLSQWKETLALLSTYGKSDEFPGLCEALAMRLEEEIADTSSATLCFMCAANVPRTVEFWTAELDAAHASLGHFDTKALQNYVEKVVVFTQANPVDSLSAECSNYFARYAELLANQGRLNVALSYLKGQNQSENILMDRLFHAEDKKVTATSSKPPPFPFARIVVERGQPVVLEAKSSSSQTVTNSSISSTAKLNTTVERSNTGAAKTRTVSNAASSGFSPSVPVVPSQPSSAPALPPGWLQLVDPTSGHPYYVNQATGQSQWEPPAGPVAPIPVASSGAATADSSVQSRPAAAAITGGKTQQTSSSSYATSTASPGPVSPAQTLSSSSSSSQQPTAAALSSTAMATSSAAVAVGASSPQVEVLGSIINNLNS
jgi:protein transport protein SEC31